MVDSIARITSALESARELTLEAAAVASSKLGETSYRKYSQGITPENLRALLTSRNSREVRDGMKKVASLMASEDSSIELETYFADVVKNISSDDIKVKRLVAIYLLRYAEKAPNMALLSVNSLQRCLSDSEPEVRALAIKAISDIRIPSLYPIVLHSVKKAITDVAPDVRSAVAYALLKVSREQPEELADDIKPLLQELLADADPEVISAALVLFKEAFPESLELLHGHYRRYCGILPQLSQWSQVYLIDLLVRYCKKFIPRPELTDRTDPSVTIPLSDNFSDIPFAVYDVNFDPDHRLFLEALTKLLYSQNSVVVVALSKAYFALTPPLTFKNSRIADVLARLVGTPALADDHFLILQCILVYCTADHTTFSQFLKKFYLFPTDDTATSVTKLKILATLVNLNNVKQVISELKYYITSDERPAVIQEALNTLAGCGRLSQGISLRITKWLLDNMAKGIPGTSLDSYVSVIRFLIQESPSEHLRTMVQLSDTLKSAKNLSGIAKAGIIWLFGELANTHFAICPDVLRNLVPNFSKEPKETRLQIVSLAAKLLSCDIDNFRSTNDNEQPYDFENSRIAQIVQSVFYLAKFDDDFDIRDRSRLFSSLFDNGKYEIASLLLQAPKPSSVSPLSLDMRSPLNGPDLSSLGLDPDIEDYLRIPSWCTDLDLEELKELRTPVPVRDYGRLKTSFSSATYFGPNPDENRASSTSALTGSEAAHTTTSRTFTSSVGKRYKLQSLDEFFSDIPQKAPGKRKVFVEESSSEESSSEDESDSDDYSSTDTDEEEETQSHSDGNLAIT